MDHLSRFIASTGILILQGLILNHLGVTIRNWEYWLVLLLTVFYMFVYVNDLL